MLVTAPLLLAVLVPSPPTPQQSLIEMRRMLPRIDETLVETAQCAAFGDVNGDGWPDAVIGRYGTDYLYHSAGSGLFDVAEAIPGAFSDTRDVELVDFDGDGDLDAFLTRPTSQPSWDAPAVFDGQGGTLVFGYDVAGAAPGLAASAAGDVDLDGDVDVVLAVTGGQDQLLRNQGGLLVLDAGAVTGPVEDSSDVELADLDGDGDLDAAFSASLWSTFGTPNRVLTNDGTGAFALLAGVDLGTNGGGLDLADVDGDGDVDACVAGSTTVLYANPGTGAFSSPGTTVAGWARDCALRDLDGDGLLDVLSFGNGAVLELHAGVAGGGYVDVTATALPLTDHVTHVGIADLDGDLDPDMLVLHTYGFLTNLWLNDAGKFAEVQTELPYLLNQQWAVAIGDVNGDGNPDAYVGDLQAKNVLFLGDGAGQWSDGSAGLPTTKGAWCVALADFDGDGDLDALYGGTGKSNLALNDGTGVMTTLVGALPANLDGTGYAHGDLDGDGDLDVVMTEPGYYSDAFHVGTNDGAGKFTEALSANLVGIPSTPRLFDADGDGDLDLMFASTGGVRFFLGDGVGGLSDATASLPLFASNAVAIADVDLDGDPDAAVVGTSPGQLWLNAGGAFQADPGFTAVPPAWQVALGDLDGDGDADVVAGDADGGVFAVNDGAGVFSPAGSFDQGTKSDLDLADLDGDGDLDVIACENGRAYQLTSVAGGQVARRTPARISKPLRMEVFGPAGAPWLLAASTGTAHIAAPPFGTVLLDPSQLWLLASGFVPNVGRAEVKFSIGPDLSILGATFHWQALVGLAPKLTNREATTVTSL